MIELIVQGAIGALIVALVFIASVGLLATAYLIVRVMWNMERL